MNNTVSYNIDRNIPRGISDQPNIVVSQRDYLSRLANLKSKYTGVMHRKEEWEKHVSKHLNIVQESQLSEIDSSEYLNLPQGSVISRSLEHRDVRIENEFNSFIYSVSSTLSALTYVISSFMSGSHSVHSHSKLVKQVSKDPENSNLSSLILKNEEEWVNNIKIRRDTATHYVSMLIKSRIEEVISVNKKIEIRSTDSLIGIIQYPEKRNYWLIEDIPLLDGSKFETKTVSKNGVDEVLYRILDSKNNIVYESSSKEGLEIQLINATEYVDHTFMNLKNYTNNVLKELNKKLI